MATKGFPNKDLVNLNMITDDAYAKLFAFNLKRFFQYSVVDIPKVLNDRDLDPLKELRDILLKHVAELFPTYATKTAINRQKKDLVIEDIMVLGKTIALNTVEEGLDNVYRPLDLNNSETMIVFVTKLKADLDATNIGLLEAKNFNNSLKAENDLLKSENDRLKSRLLICEIKLGICIESDNGGLSEQQLSSDSNISDLESEADSVRPQDKKRVKKTHRKAVVIKTSVPKMQPEPVQPASNPIPVEAGSKNTYAFIGNVKAVCTSESILKHITEKIKVPLKITDIKELNIKSNNKAFKVTVPQGMLNKVISNWPDNIKAEPYELPKTKGTAHRSSKGNHKRQQKFRGSFPNSNKFHHNRHWGRHYEPYGEYQESYQPYYRY